MIGAQRNYRFCIQAQLASASRATLPPQDASPCAAELPLFNKLQFVNRHESSFRLSFAQRNYRFSANSVSCVQIHRSCMQKRRSGTTGTGHHLNRPAPASDPAAHQAPPARWISLLVSASCCAEELPFTLPFIFNELVISCAEELPEAAQKNYRPERLFSRPES